MSKNSTDQAGTSNMDKKSVFSLQNFVKDEPMSNGTGRLQSFRIPRDLSLGGTKPKKLYTPNLNVARLKSKPKDITRKESKKTSRNHETRQNTKPFPNTKFIQTQGVFSEGSGEIRPSFGRSENHNNYRQHDVMPVPKIRKKSFNVEDTTKKEDDGVLDTLFRDSENEEEEYEDIYEPLVLSGEMFTKQLDLKTNACGVVKLENEIKGGAEAVKLNMNQENLSYKFLESEQYSDSNMCFSLLQFPDSFAGRGGSGDPDDKNLDFKLSNVAEGKIGKIIIRKSGRMQLQIGRKFYDFEVARSAAFTQDIIAVNVDGETTKIGNIGSVDEQYLVTPEWKQLFRI